VSCYTNWKNGLRKATIALDFLVLDIIIALDFLVLAVIIALDFLVLRIFDWIYLPEYVHKTDDRQRFTGLEQVIIQKTFAYSRSQAGRKINGS
jgi:hypothetical protein